MAIDAGRRGNEDRNYTPRARRPNEFEASIHFRNGRRFLPWGCHLNLPSASINQTFVFFAHIDTVE
jgi:hypothetical protein